MHIELPPQPETQLTPAEVVVERVDMAQAIWQAAGAGYAFTAEAITPTACQAMEAEVDRLRMEEGDHIASPIYAGTAREVRQLHERAYRPIEYPDVMVARTVAVGLMEEGAELWGRYPELFRWVPTEVGYQRYRSTDDHISPHRDRRSDELLAATITINGSALVRILETVDDPNDYRSVNLRLIDKYRTTPGSVMFLRAPGLGIGDQVIHEVLPPDEGSRLILNLRMRPDVLAPPDQAI